MRKEGEGVTGGVRSSVREREGVRRAAAVLNAKRAKMLVGWGDAGSAHARERENERAGERTGRNTGRGSGPSPSGVRGRRERLGWAAFRRGLERRERGF